MGRYTEAEIEDLAAGFIQFLTKADIEDEGEVEEKAKAKAKPKEAFVGQAKLVKALKSHYVNFAGSKLAEASRKRTATKKNPKGRCGLYSLVLTWASLNKNVACREWAERKGSSKQLRKWYDKL